MTRRALITLAAIALALTTLAPAGAASTGGELMFLPDLEARAEIVRDVDGIPHVLASNAHDLFFLQGWIHAEDRLFQMDATRRQASGTLAELFGASVLGSDIELQTLGLRRAAERSLPLLSDESREALEAYADGVNAWVANHPLPVEYGLLELTSFEPWTPVDSIVISKVIAFSLSFDLDIGLTETFLTYQGVGAAAGFDGAALFSEDLFRSAPFDPAVTVPDATGVAPSPPPVNPPRRPRSGTDLRQGAVTLRTPTPDVVPSVEAAASIDTATLDLAGDILERWSAVPVLANALDRAEEQQGSNEWGVAGSLTVDGRPIIANDPHLSLNTPSTFYENHLYAPRAGYDVTGSGFAGVPGVILGQNRHISWGATTNPMDVTDTYQEQIVVDPTSPSGLATIYQGNREPIIPVPLEFRVNQLDGVPDNVTVVPPGGSVPPAALIVPRRNHGPILGLDLASGVGLSVQYTGFSGTREVDTFLDWNRAKNLDDFLEGLSKFDFGSQNWAYFDVHGNLAYFTSGEMPVREDLQAGFVNGAPPWFIRNGTGGNEWLPVQNPQPNQAVPFEVLPQDELPHVVNPPAGFFVNANNDPAGTTLDNNPLNQLRPGGGIYYLNPGYASGFRAGRITKALTELLDERKVTVEDMAMIQANVELLDGEVLAPHIVAAFDHASDPSAPAALSAFAADPEIAEAVARLVGWNGWAPTGVPEGYDASDVDGVRLPPTQGEIDASIAATIYSVWRGQMVRNTIDATLAPFGLPSPGSAQAMSALRHLLDAFPANQGIGASGLDFFPVGTGDREADRDVVILQSLRDALDRLAGDPFAPAFGNSTDQDDYRWGRLHRIVLDAPLGGPFDIPPAGGAFPPSFPDLPGLATDGGFGAVDASSHSARADDAGDFMFGGGPVRRYVGQKSVTTRIVGQSSLPGGSSGVLGSPWYVNLLGEWLTNETHPLRTVLGDIRANTAERTIFVPPGRRRL